MRVRHDFPRMVFFVVISVIAVFLLNGCAQMASQAEVWYLEPSYMNALGGILFVLVLSLFWVWVMRSQVRSSTSALQKELEEHRRTEAALRASENKMRAIYESASNAAMIVVDIFDETHSILEFSPGAEKLFGYARDEIVGKPLSLLNRVEDAPLYEEIITRLRAGQTGYQGEMLRVHKSGKIFPTLLSVNPYFDKDGNVAGAVGISMDISDRMEMEDTLRHSEEKFAQVFRLSPDALSITHIPEGQFLDVNQSFIKMTGYSAEEVLGKTTQELGFWINPADRERYIQQMEQNGEVIDFEIELRAKDGSIHLASISSTFIELYNKICALTITHDITERRRQETRIQRQIARFSALSAIDRAITGNMSLSDTLRIITERAAALLEPDACGILLLQDDTGMLMMANGSGFRSQEFLTRRMRLGEGMAGRVAQSKNHFYINQPSDLAFVGVTDFVIRQEDFHAYFAEPLVAKGVVKGVLELYFRRAFEPDAEWIEFLQALAGQAAIALDNAGMLENLQQANIEMNLAYNETIEGWARALELRDGETRGHSIRVMELTTTLANRLGISGAALMDVRRGALLHDIGKMGIPDSILLKNDLLTPDEWDVMRKHPLLAYQLLSGVDFLRGALDIPYAHHERWDGSGYPNGLKGEEIPLAARIFAVVDVYDALSSDRPYRKAWPAERIRSFMETQSGKHFDPQVLEVFMTYLDEREAR